MRTCPDCKTTILADHWTHCIDCRCALPPVRSEPLLDVAKRLSDAWSMIDNALDGLAMRGEHDSPLVRDLREAQEEVETSRQAIYTYTSNAERDLRGASPRNGPRSCSQENT